MALILGMGLGLFMLVLIWSLSIVLCGISSKLKSPFSYIGIVCISIAFLLSTILLWLPRESITQTTTTTANFLDKTNNIAHRWNNSSVRVSVSQHQHQQTLVVAPDWTTYVTLPTYLVLALLLLTLSSMLVFRHILSTSQRHKLLTNIHTKTIQLPS